MTDKELTLAINGVINEMKATRLKRAHSYASDITARIKRRVINTGRTAYENRPTFGNYSTAYALWRQRNNLTAPPFPVKNFKKTGRMWTNTKGFASPGPYPDSMSIYVGPTDPEELEKLAWQEEQTNATILTLSTKETELQDRVEIRKIVRIMKKHKLLV